MHYIRIVRIVKFYINALLFFGWFPERKLNSGRGGESPET